MKKIILIGDSIRLGYDKYVKDALSSVAEVYYPNDSARFSEYTLRYLSDWKHDNGWGEDIDLVHWNTGLWDVLEMYGEAPISNPQQYGETIAKISRQIKILFPKAKQVFATSTSVIEESTLDQKEVHVGNENRGSLPSSQEIYDMPIQEDVDMVGNGAISCDNGFVGESQEPESEEQRSAKRMRLTPPDEGGKCLA